GRTEQDRLLSRGQGEDGRSGLGAAGEIRRQAGLSVPADMQDASRPARPKLAGARRVAFVLDRAIATAAEGVAAALVLAEVVILFCGVIARYGFDSPLIWSDELATFLFLWLCMLGAVVALQRGAHMRLTTLVAWVPPAMAAW